MATKTINWKGGASYRKHLEAIASRLGRRPSVQVGFFEDERYTSVHPTRGTPRKPLSVAQVAFWNNYGTSRSPARPFFDVMVRGNSGNWPKQMASIAKATNYDGARTMGLMGELLKDQLVASIRNWSQPPNAPATVAIKGFNKPLIDDGTMQRAVGARVST